MIKASQARNGYESILECSEHLSLDRNDIKDVFGSVI
jgi:hypothetical protein